MAEKGYVVGESLTPAWSSFGFDEEDNPDLVFPRSVPVYRRMRREETQLQTVLKAVKLPILRTNWWLDVEGVDDEVAGFVAQNLGLPTQGGGKTVQGRRRGRFSWYEHLRLALTMLDYGFSFFEQVYEPREDGRLWLRKLGYRPQGTINRINVARDGGLDSIVQAGASVGGGVRIPVDRLVAYVNEREGANWAGQSIMRASYKYWLLKDRLLRVQAMTVERNGLGVPVYTGAKQDDTGLVDPEVVQSREEADLDNGLKIAQGFRSGKSAGASIPNSADLKLLGVTGQLPDAMEPIKYYDEQMAKSALAHFLTLGTQTGSWALGTTFADFFTMSLQTVAKNIAEVATQHVIEDLVDLNFGETIAAPRLEFDEVGSQTAPTAQALQSMVQTGVIRPDDGVEEFMRRRYGLPEIDDDSVRTVVKQSDSELKEVSDGEG